MVSGDPAGAPPTPEYCAQVAAKHGLQANLACDPEDSMAAYGKNGLAVVLGVDGAIAFKKQSPTIDTLKSRTDQALGDSDSLK